MFEWKWLLIGLRGFIDRFWQNKFPPKSRYGVQTRLRALLEPAITVLNPLPVLIILLNPLPVLVARWKILREILLFTCSFMINTHPLVGCLENSDRKVKQFRVIPWIASSHLVYCSLIHCPNWNVSGSAPRIPICIATLTRNRHCANRTAWLEWLLNHPQ